MKSHSKKPPATVTSWDDSLPFQVWVSVNDRWPDDAGWRLTAAFSMSMDATTWAEEVSENRKAPVYVRTPSAVWKVTQSGSEQVA